MNRRKNTIRKQLTISYVFLILLSTVLLNIVQFCQIYKYTKDQQQNEIEKELYRQKIIFRLFFPRSIPYDARLLKWF